MDDDLRRRARAARAEVEGQVDLESELASRPTPSGLAPVTAVPPRRRLVATTGAIASVAVAIVGGVVLLRGPNSIETTELSDVTTSIPAPSATPTTAVSLPTTRGDPTTTVVPTTPPTTSAAQTETAAVSYLDPPPAVTLEPLGVVAVPEESTGTYQVAIGDLGVAVMSSSYEAEVARVDVIGFDGSTRAVDDLGFTNMIAYGPGDVMYSTVSDQSIEEFAVGAIPLSGDRLGKLVASEPADINRYLEYPLSSFGHGAAGVSMRRDDGQVAIGYVDVDGEPTALDTATTFYDSDPSGLDEGQVTVTASTGKTWSLSIDAHPDHASPFVGPSPAAPSSDGNGVFWTHIGPDLAPDVDFGEASQWTVAQLRPDGSAMWWSLPDGWTIAASDIWGTVAVRQAGDRLDVALIDFATDGQPATTTTTTTARPTVPATTVPTEAVPWRSLRWEAAGIERNCSDDENAGCTRILVDRDGSIVSYDPTTRTLTRHTTPPITTPVDEDLGLVYVELLGPDDVVYLNVDAATPGDGAADLVAMSLTADDAGRVLGRWAGITDRVGDRDLVAARDGLVVVGCCDHGVLRPATDAEIVLAWVGRDGREASLSGPVVRTEVDLPTLTVHRDDDLPVGTRTWTFEPPADWQPRGMPTVIPTFDGGFVATTFGTGQAVIRGWSDGTIHMITIDDDGDGTIGFPTLDPNGRATIADGDRFARFEPFSDRAGFWSGRPEIGDDGTIALPDIDGEAGWARDPIAFGNAVAGRIEVNERRTIELDRDGDDEFVVTVTTSNFFDDSRSASRLELVLARDADGRFRFATGQWAQACQPGRGHQDFSAELCV